MPDIVALHAEDPAGAAAGGGKGGLYQSKRYISFKVHGASNGELSKPQLQPVRSGRTHQFSYTKNWGEVSNTLRKKLSERLSALNENNDSNGEADRHGQSGSEVAAKGNSSQVTNGSSSESVVLRKMSTQSAKHDASETPPDQARPTNGLNRGNVASKYLFGVNANGASPSVPTSGSTLAAVTASVSAAARLNRTGTAFQGMTVSLSPRSSRSGSPKKTIAKPGDSQEAARSATPEREPVPRVVSSLAGPRVATPERGEYRTLMSLLVRSATPERGSLRSRTHKSGEQRSGSRSSTPGAPERKSVSPEKVLTGQREADGKNDTELTKKVNGDARRSPPREEKSNGRQAVKEREKSNRHDETTRAKQSRDTRHSTVTETPPDSGSMTRGGKLVGSARMRSYQDSISPKSSKSSESEIMKTPDEHLTESMQALPTRSHSRSSSGRGSTPNGNNTHTSNDCDSSVSDQGLTVQSGMMPSLGTSYAVNSTADAAQSELSFGEHAGETHDASSMSDSVQSSDGFGRNDANSVAEEHANTISRNEIISRHMESTKKPRTKTPPSELDETEVGHPKKTRAKTPSSDYGHTGTVPRPRAKTPPVDYDEQETSTIISEGSEEVVHGRFTPSSENRHAETVTKPRAETPPVDYDEDETTKTSTDKSEEQVEHGRLSANRCDSPATDVWTNGSANGHEFDDNYGSMKDDESEVSSHWVNHVSKRAGIHTVSEQPDSWSDNVSDEEMTLNDSLEDGNPPPQRNAFDSSSHNVARQPEEESKCVHPNGLNHSDDESNGEDIYGTMASPSPAVLPLIPRASSLRRDPRADGTDTSHQAHPITQPVTHFVEVTSIEDGQRRITYVENGVTVEPVIPSRKNRGTFTKKSRRVRQPEVIQEADEEAEDATCAEKTRDDGNNGENRTLSSKSRVGKHSPMRSPKPRVPSPDEEVMDIDKTHENGGSEEGPTLPCKSSARRQSPVSTSKPRAPSPTEDKVVTEARDSEKSGDVPTLPSKSPSRRQSPVCSSKPRAPSPPEDELDTEKIQDNVELEDRTFHSQSPPVRRQSPVGSAKPHAPSPAPLDPPTENECTTEEENDTKYTDEAANEPDPGDVSEHRSYSSSLHRPVSSEATVADEKGPEIEVGLDQEEPQETNSNQSFVRKSPSPSTLSAKDSHPETTSLKRRKEDTMTSAFDERISSASSPQQSRASSPQKSGARSPNAERTDSSGSAVVEENTFPASASPSPRLSSPPMPSPPRSPLSPMDNISADSLTLKKSPASGRSSSLSGSHIEQNYVAEPTSKHAKEEPNVVPYSPLPGPSTGAVPKQRQWRGSQVVKFPKDRSRGRATGRAYSEQLRFFGDSSDYEPVVMRSGSATLVSSSSQTACDAAVSSAGVLPSSDVSSRLPVPTSDLPSKDRRRSDGSLPPPSPAIPSAEALMGTHNGRPVSSPPIVHVTVPADGPSISVSTPPPAPSLVPTASPSERQEQGPQSRLHSPSESPQPLKAKAVDRGTNTPTEMSPQRMHQMQQTPPPEEDMDVMASGEHQEPIYGVLPMSAAHSAATATATIAAAAAAAATAVGATPVIAAAAATAAAVAATATSPTPAPAQKTSNPATAEASESTRPRIDAEIPLGSVALKQALYESISEERASRRTSELPAPLPGMVPAKWARPPATENGATTTETAQTPKQANGLDETVKTPDTEAHEAAEEEQNVEEKPRRERVFRIRRSALEALRYRIPQLRDIVRTRFRSNEISITNGSNPVLAAAAGSPVPTDAWSTRPPDDPRLEVESDSDLSTHSPAGGDASNEGLAAGHKPTQDDGKHSLLQYAMLHFRDAEEKYNMLREEGGATGSIKFEKKKGKKKGKEDWTWREQVEMVKWSDQPLQASLLKLESAERAGSHGKAESGELNRQALDCFLSIQRYMGDQPMAKDMAEVDCVYTILMACHRAVPLRDEVYCQLMRQTTSNKSTHPDSCQRGWRLFSIVAAYFSCSDGLRPYLFKYLETAAYDKRRAYHGTAMVCLQNLRKTFRFGGRKNVPSIEEITAITAGRNSKRQIYRLPGGTERVINTRSTSVVQDIIEDICSVIKIRTREEMDEFSLYCIVEGDTFTMPLAREEYILDVTTELQKNEQIFYLIFCRSVWYFPLRLESHLYVEVVFNQIAPDYLEGLLLVMPGETLHEEVVYDISRVAALLHRAADMSAVPTMKETKYLLPKAALMVRDIKPPQWVNMVQDSWSEVHDKTPMEAKAAVLEILERWPLFGSSFFAVSRVTESREAVDHILALNRGGVHFLDSVTHETLARYPFSEVISTRKVKTEEGTLFLDMKYGNLMQQKVVSIQSDNAHEISRLIRQYISIEQKHQPSQRGAEEAREGQASR